jgi:hypothetical protein
LAYGSRSSHTQLHFLFQGTCAAVLATGRLLILTRRIGWFAAFVILLALVVSFSKLLMCSFSRRRKECLTQR